MPPEKVTLVIDYLDKDEINNLAREFHCSNEEAGRRAIRIAYKLVAWQDDGGSIILERNGDRTRMEFT